MSELNIKSADLARWLPIDPAVISRWRTGSRVPKDAKIIDRIALYITLAAKTEKEKSMLNSLITDYENDQCMADKITLWLFDGKDIHTQTASQLQTAGMCFPGADGFLKVVSMLEHTCRGTNRNEISVYISTEHMDLILDERIHGIWERLYRINSKPVPVMLEQSLDSIRLSMLFASLLPYIQAGRLQLYHIPSTGRQFCYNLTILAKGRCMVMAMEPPGVHDASVSMFVDRLSFVGGVGEKLAELKESAKPMLRLDADAFIRLVVKDVVLNSYNELLAKTIHADYLARNMHHSKDLSYSTEWDSLPEEIKNSNREQAQSIPGKLLLVRCAFDAGDTPYPTLTEFTPDEIMLLAQNEHIRWIEEKTRSGWVYGAVRDNNKKVHPCMVEWDKLPEYEQQKDIDTAENIISLLKMAGLRVYRMS